MVKRRVTITESVVEAVAAIAWYIESQGMIVTAEKFTDDVYDFFEKLSDSRRVHAICREPERALFGL